MLLPFATPSTKPFLPLSKLVLVVMESFIFRTVGYEGRAMITAGCILPSRRFAPTLWNGAIRAECQFRQRRPPPYFQISKEWPGMFHCWPEEGPTGFWTKLAGSNTTA